MAMESPKVQLATPRVLSRYVWGWLYLKAGSHLTFAFASEFQKHVKSYLTQMQTLGTNITVLYKLVLNTLKAKE